jgi:hypothetical protein
MSAPRPKKILLPTNASFILQPLQLCQDIQQVSYQLNAPLTSTPVFSFKLQGSNDIDAVISDQSAFQNTGTAGTTANWVDMTLPSGSVHGTGFTVTLPGVSVSWNGAAALSCIIDVTDPPWALRLVGTYTSGGVAGLVMSIIPQLRGPRV